jgi:FAD/FMN-containing dehydrogenase
MSEQPDLVDTSKFELSPQMLSFLDDVAGIPVTTDRQRVRRKSRDFFWYSPVLNAELAQKSADLTVTPQSEADVIRIAMAAAHYRLPVTPRAAGTGNYGQAVPLEGGILIDMTALDAVEWMRSGLVRTGPGIKMSDLDEALRPSGFELRMHPSTKRTATIGGFVAGGSGGVGSVTWGGLRDPGNVLAARVVTLEAEPRVIELRGNAAQYVNHAYGTTGLITALEIPLAPRWEWIDVAIACDDFFTAAEIGLEVALADGVIKKLVTPIAWPIPSFFGPLRPYCPDGKAMLLCMIAEPSMESFKAIIAGRGKTTLEAETDDSPGRTPLYEYTWNHTTLQALKTDRTITYLQCLLPSERPIAALREVSNLFGSELMQHLEFLRFGGRMTASSLPLFHYTTKERLDEIIAIHEAIGISIANPHVVTLEGGSAHKRVDADQLGFKREADPFGLLNPGKMQSYTPLAPPAA